MFTHIPSTEFKFNFNIVKLSDEMKYLEQVAIWTEKQWGFLRNNPGIEKRKELTKAIKDNLYLIIYAGQPVGMFALHNHEVLSVVETLQSNEETKEPTSKVVKVKAKELTHVYIDKRVRGMGLGGRMIEAAKKIAKEQGVELVLLDTLNPNLNKFYEKHGAKVICDSQFLSHPSTMLRIKL